MECYASPYAILRQTYAVDDPMMHDNPTLNVGVGGGRNLVHRIPRLLNTYASPYAILCQTYVPTRVLTQYYAKLMHNVIR